MRYNPFVGIGEQIAKYPGDHANHFIAYVGLKQQCGHQKLAGQHDENRTIANVFAIVAH